MPFTVVPPGPQRLDHDAYLSLLFQQGVDLTSAPRVASPACPEDRWLHVWDTREEAERFARDVQKFTRLKGWRVEEVPVERVSRGRLARLEITVGCQSDGFVYGLHPRTERLLDRHFSSGYRPRNVFIGTTRKEEFEEHQWEFIDEVVRLLTRLTLEQVESLGGYEVYDPDRDRVLHPAPVRGASSPTTDGARRSAV